MKNAKTPLIVITGPTASGKTALAINLAKKTGAEIISADSRSVYKGLDIVSAKPSLKEREGIVHHLIDIKEPLDIPYSAGDFVKDALSAIDVIQSKDKPVIISGGTWFYIKCLLDTDMLPEIPSDPSLRKELETLDNVELWEKLNSLDKLRASKIHPNNKERVIRALEMVITAGKEVSRAERAKNPLKSIWFSNDFILEDNRKELYKRINLRVEKMMEDGLYDEWQRMKTKHSRTKVLYNTIGYKEFFELEDKVYNSKEEAVEKIKQRTRNFAKRQLTFFKTRPDIIKVKNEDDILAIL